MPFGSFAISTTSPQFATMFTTLNKAHLASVCFGDAVQMNTPEKWKRAAEVAKNMSPFNFEVNSENDATHLNLAVVADKRDELAAACLAMALYTDPVNHTIVAKLKEMETENTAACELALLNSTLIRGRRSTVECEHNLELAAAAIPAITAGANADNENAADVISTYKLAASTAVCAFTKIPSEMANKLPPELHERISRVQDTLKQYYANDYDQLMRDADIAWVAN
jgi:hypothetical protein